MEISYKSKKLFGIIVPILLFLLLSTVCQAASLSIEWKMDFENKTIGGFSVDNNNNIYYSYWNDNAEEYYYSKVTQEGQIEYNKTASPKPDSSTYWIDDSGNFFFVEIKDKISESNYLGKVFTFSKYDCNLTYESTSIVNLTSYFQNNFTANLYHVNDESAYFAIWEYQTEYNDLDRLLLAKFEISGELEWNRTVAINPDRTIFGFCKNSIGNIYVENNDVLYYIDDETGINIWQREIIINDPTISSEDQALVAFQENVLLVDFVLDGRLFLKLCMLDNSVGWEMTIGAESISNFLTIMSLVVEDEYLAISVKEGSFDFDKKEKITTFQLQLLNISKDVFYKDTVEFKDDDETGGDIWRAMKVYPTNDGNFYLYESYEDRVNEIKESTIKYCLPKFNSISGYTIPIVFTSFAFLYLAVVIRRKIRKQ